jgi:dihydroxy-acid dehydratase
MICASNRLAGHTDSANGVVPLPVAEDAHLDYRTNVSLIVDGNLAEQP